MVSCLFVKQCIVCSAERTESENPKFAEKN